MNADAAHRHDPAWYIDHYERETSRFATLLDGADLDAPVATCGDWTVGDLAAHLGGVHRWANFCALNARHPSSDDRAAFPGFDADDPAQWYRDCADELAATLRSLDPDAPTWHPFPVAQVAAFWPRRQAHESAIHRWDLESAVGVPSPIDPELASDGIDEYFEAVVPRLIQREGIVVPESSFHVHCTDVDGEWLVWNANGEYGMRRAHEKGDAALRGPAEAILLRLVNRTIELTDPLAPVGDEQVLTAWLSIPGL